MSSPRIQVPLHDNPTRLADDLFYLRHPEMVVNGKRVPLDPTRNPQQRELANEWMDLYVASHGPEDEGPFARTTDSQALDSAVKPCDQVDPVLKFHHVIVLVPGTVQPVNLLPAFGYDGNAVPRAGSGRGYWGDGFIGDVDKLMGLIDKKFSKEGAAGKYAGKTYYGFEWSGDNNHNERVIAGGVLLKTLWAQFSMWQGEPVYFHLIGHSHGGNVINEFTRLVGRAYANGARGSRLMFGDRWFIKSVTYLSTPFFTIIEPPHAGMFMSSAQVVNVFNRFDMTQRFVADFTMKPLAPVVEKLKPSITKVQDSFAALTQIISKAWDERWKIAWDKEYRNKTISDIRNQIIQLLDSVIALIQNFLDTCVEGSEAPEEIKGIVRPGFEAIIARLKAAKAGNVTTGLYNDLLVILTALDEFCSGEGPLFNAIALVVLDKMEFFDNTKNTLDHYSAYKALGRKVFDITSLDQYYYDQFNKNFELFMSRLAEVENSLHGKLSASEPSFRKKRWEKYKYTRLLISKLFNWLIAQVAFTAIENIRNTLGYIEVLRQLPLIGCGDKELSEKIGNRVVLLQGFLDSLLDKNQSLFDPTKKPLDVNQPGTLPYLMMTSHSLSHALLHPQAGTGGAGLKEFLQGSA